MNWDPTMWAASRLSTCPVSGPTNLIFQSESNSLSAFCKLHFLLFVYCLYSLSRLICLPLYFYTPPPLCLFDSFLPSLCLFFPPGKDSKTEVTPASPVALVPEEKVSFSLYALSVSTLTVAKIRKVYNKLDSKAIAKQVRHDRMKVTMLVC